MRKLMIAAAAGAASLALPTAAQAQSVTVVPGATAAIPLNNDFFAQLTGLGLADYTTTGALLTLSGPAIITFEFLGSESGFSDTFSVPTAALSYTEMTSYVDNFGSPVLIGSAGFVGGSLAGLLNFTSSGGAPATAGTDGFGIFLPAGYAGGALTTFYLGYDDQITGPDDNHDDMIIRATVSPVPEPGTWAMMLFGFGMIGFAVRRHRKPAMLPQIA